ncbi:DNA repair protein RecO [Candidatus Nomurabacteria bacterium]|nr:DNA repair protein RecO [Candidatus Nomurabacteria bacterium]
MAYATYTTEALVCGSRDNNTSDRAFLLFTKEAGMLWASARSVREERSKQRFALQDFSLIRVSLVRGKSGWRIGSAECLDNFYTLAPDRETRGAVTRVLRLVRQFVHGEEPQPRLFAEVQEVLPRIAGGAVAASLAADVATLRMLYVLGYVQKTPSLTAYLESAWPTCLKPLTEEAEKAIEQAFSVSHLG